ncbi:MAG TPA: diguanylate cyclase, partial [Pilimelia sp.]|nr:diguanylate cyclase [Pilimelia sp.]
HADPNIDPEAAPDAAPDVDPDRVYQVARHYLLGGTGDRPDRVFRAAAAAGAAALAQLAPADALDFLTQANAAAEVAGLRPGPGFHADLGLAAHRLGRYDLAREQLQLALDGETDPERRAHVCRLLADAHLLRYEGDQAIERVRQGLAELGHPLPRNPLLLSVSTLALSGWGAVLARLPARWRAVPPATAQRYRLRVALTGTGGEAATMAQRLPLVAALLLRTMPLAQHLRPGPEYILNQGGVAFLAGAMGRRRRCERILGRATEAARRTGDLGLTARLHYFRGVVLDMLPPMSSTSGADLTDIIAEQGRWMDVGLHLTMAATLEQMLLVRGHARLAAESHHQVLTRVQGDDEVLRHMFTAVGAQIAALSGQPAEAARQLRVAREALASMPGNTVLRTKVAIAAVHLAVEQGEVGDVLDAALAEFHALGTTPAKAWNIDRAFWVHQAFGRLAQVGAANPADRARLLATAADAVRQLRRAANGPVLRAYADVAHCALRQLRGDNAGALRRLARVDQHRHGLDLPLLYFDMARIRARAYQGLGRHADARWQARIAALVAAEQGWVTRVRWVQAEFGVVDGGRATASPATGSHRRTATSTVNVDVTAAATGINQRRLQSLQQVGLAAATTLDPAQVARLVLDEIVSVFAAERAFLFLREPGGDGDELRPYLGRDDARADLTVLTGYGSTLVDRVRDTGEPLVVTGSEEGAALGSQSSLIHGLRSIMVAPLQLKGRLIGVIYLDSRTAKGIFTTADLDILAAITHHVATSLETARAAQLELGIQAARRERDLAQLLHRAMTDLGASLDPQQVAQRLVDTVAAALPVAAAVLLRCADDGSTTVSAALGNGTAAVGAAVPAVGLGADGGRLGVDAAADLPPGLLGTETGAWLAVPLTVRGEQRGLLIAGAPPARPYTEAEVDIAAALAGQGAVALENALLFRQVEELATRDSLTGLFNRRHFFDFARHRVAASHRYERPMAVVMIDIDHFKRVNDTHGHLAGDDVIREVAHRLASTLRDSDVICRYGGEEFAVLLPETAQEDACVAAARLHQVVGATPVATRVGPLPVTVSVGLAAPAGGDDVNSLIQHADEALYKAKRAGRNQIATHP